MLIKWAATWTVTMHGHGSTLASPPWWELMAQREARSEPRHALTDAMDARKEDVEEAVHDAA